MSQVSIPRIGRRSIMSTAIRGALSSRMRFTRPKKVPVSPLPPNSVPVRKIYDEIQDQASLLDTMSLPRPREL